MKVTEEMVIRFIVEYSACGIENWFEAVSHCLESALANIPEPVPGPFVLSEEEAKALERERGRWGSGQTRNLVCDALDRACKTLAVPAQAGGEWTEADKEAAYKAYEDCDTPLVVAAVMDALKHRIAAPAVSSAAAPRVLSASDRLVIRNAVAACVRRGWEETGDGIRELFDRVERTLAAPAIEPLSPNERMAIAASITMWRDDGHEGKAVLLEDVLARFPKPAPKPTRSEELAHAIRVNREHPAHMDVFVEELLALAKKGEK